MLNNPLVRRLIPRAAAASVLAIAAAAHAATPQLTVVTPRGAQRGAEVEVTLAGDRLADAQEVMLYGTGLTVTDVKPVEGGKRATAKFKVAPDAKLGEHTLRLRTASGVSELRTFYVGALPVVQEEADLSAPGARVGGRRRREMMAEGAAVAAAPAKPAAGAKKQPSTFEAPQHIDLNVTVAGVIEQEQVDYYSVDCKKGQRLSVEVEAMRLGAVLDPSVKILDADRNELATSDDTALLRQDCAASVVIPADGTYVVQINESSYGGSASSHYRMHVGTFPRPKAVYPAGGKAGEEVRVRFVGDARGDIEQTVKVPATPGEAFAVFAEQDGQTAPSANVFRVSGFPNVLEAEPNDELAQANGAAGTAAAEAPVAFNGILEKAGDVDFFKFKASKGQQFDVNVYGRRVRSPIDPVLVVANAKGGQVAQSDDSGGPDSYAKVSIPADGEYVVSVRDHLKRGGPEFVYRVEVTPVEPKIVVALPDFSPPGQYTQDRQAIVVPKGNRYGTTIRTTRSDFNGVITLSGADLPPGVKLIAEPAPQGVDTFPVIFEAAADAKVGGKFCDLDAVGKNDKGEITGKFAQKVDLAMSNQQGQAYYSTSASKLAVAVADELPFKVEMVPPKAPIVQGGAMDVKVRAVRTNNFKGAITVKALWDPPGLSSGTVTIEPDQTEVMLPFSATAAAAPKTWKTAVLAQADVNGKAFTASELTPIEVAPPFATMKIERAVVKQGESVQVKAIVDQKVPFEGKAKVELLGLPNEAKADPVEITSDAKEAVFNVTTTAKTPAGSHGTLICRMVVTKDGEPVLHNLAQGGIIRIDAPKNPAGPSKLEKLREGK